MAEKEAWQRTEFSRFILRKRKELGKTQQQLADELNLDQGYISQLERGRPPSASLEFLRPYAQALGVPTEVLIREGGLRLENIYSIDTNNLDADVQTLLGRVKVLRPIQVRQLTVLAEAMADDVFMDEDRRAIEFVKEYFREMPEMEAQEALTLLRQLAQQHDASQATDQGKQAHPPHEPLTP